jgi:hypothetical protein
MTDPCISFRLFWMYYEIFRPSARGMISYVKKEVLQSIGPSSQNHTHKS